MRALQLHPTGSVAICTGSEYVLPVPREEYISGKYGMDGIVCYVELMGGGGVRCSQRVMEGGCHWRKGVMGGWGWGLLGGGRGVAG